MTAEHTERFETLSAAAPDIIPASNPRRRWSRRVAADIVGLGEAVCIMLASAAPAVIYRAAGELEINWAILLQSSMCAAIITHLLLRTWNMYDTKRMHDFPISAATLLAALSCGLVATIGLGVPQPVRAGHQWIWLITWFSASFTLIIIWRSLVKKVLAALTAAGRFEERVAVFGAGSIARRVHDHLSDPKLGINFMGVFDDRAVSNRVDADGLEIAGRLEDLIEAARAEKIDRIIIALPQAANARISLIARRLEQLPVSLHVVTHIASDYLEKVKDVRVSNLGAVGMIDVKPKALSDWAPIIKRAEDLLLGGALMILSAPLFPLIAAAIRLETRGPVLFRQRRRGFNQDIIEIYKFRTMRVLEDGADVRQATTNDDRVTRIGRILRRTSLDELPQLWNVVKGDMSLVGPRPHALVHDEQFSELLEHYANRHQVKPGLTGLAQVRGLRGQTKTAMSIEARVNADMAYIKNWSLGLDLKIIAKTIWAVIAAKNAH